MKIKWTCALLGISVGVIWALPAEAGEAAKGKALFEKNCVSCHGADGKGNPAMAKVLGEKGLNIVTKETQAKKDEELLKVIVEGAGKMPAAGKNLSKQEQKEVLSYTRTLAKDIK